MALRARPLTVKQANDYITRHHRHHKPVVGHRFSIGYPGIARAMAAQWGK